MSNSNHVTSQAIRGLGISRINGREQALMTSEKEMLYVVGRNVMWHNIVRDRVRVLPQTPRVQKIIALAVCPKRRYVAVCEQQDASYGSAALPQVSIIDLISGAGPKRLRTLIATEDTHLSFNTIANADGTASPMPTFACADFSKDSKSLLCLVGAPYNGLVVFDWFRSRKVGTCTVNAAITRCRFNPTDSSQVSTSGPQHLRVWKVQEGMLKGYPTIQGIGGTNASVTDHDWTRDDRIAVTTDHGEVMIYDEGDLVQTIDSDTLGLDARDGLSSITSLDDRGFLCGGPHATICVVEMTDTKDRLEGRDPFKVACKVRAIKDDATPQTVVSLGMSPKCDVVVVAFPDNVGMLNMSDVWLKAEQGGDSGNADDATRGGSGSGVRTMVGEDEEEGKKESSVVDSDLAIGVENNGEEEKMRNQNERRSGSHGNDDMQTTKRIECNLSYLVKGFHTGTITAISSCARKPLVVTCSKEDKSIRLWNYRTHVCVDALTFQNDAQRMYYL